MSYTKTDWINLPNQTTPVNATNLNKIETELETLDNASTNSLTQRTNVANNTNLNDVTNTGIYYIPDVTLTNAPANYYKYSTLVVINNSGVIQQYISRPVGNTFVMREYSGYPASWGNWRTVDFNVYSTSERVVGVWKDGKPIYRKTVVIANTALSAGNNTIPHGISNIKQYIKVEANKEGSQILPYININANNELQSGTFVTNIDSTNITMRVFNDSWGAGNTWNITIDYTKTTD
jgi:hypothetical protein